MPLLRKPTTEELEDHFFGSGAFQFGWFEVGRIFSTDKPGTFPCKISVLDEDGSLIDQHRITESDFVNGIKAYAVSLPDRTFDDLIEDMDAGDVDAVLQLIIFGEIRYNA